MRPIMSGCRNPDTGGISPFSFLSKEILLARVRTMAKVTSKLQVTIPKRIAERFGISPGDDIEFVAAGDNISIRPAGRHAAARLSPAERLRLFRTATVRQEARNKALRVSGAAESSRDWTREELYDRARPR